MKVIAAAKCKATFLSVLAEVESRREPVTITKNGRAVAMVIPLVKQKNSLADFYIGPGQTFGDIVSPVMDPEDYEALR